MTNNEGGTNDEEFRNVAIVDRVNTTMAVWMGTTISIRGQYGPAFAILSPILQTTGSKGKFSFMDSLSRADATGFKLEIKAEGYWPTQLNIAAPLTNDSRFNFELGRREATTKSP